MKLYLSFLILTFFAISNINAQLSINTMDVTFEKLELIENADGESYRLEAEYSPKGEHTTILYRINNPNERASAWDVVPKPSAVPKSTFIRGNIYEFAACYKYAPGLVGSIVC